MSPARGALLIVDDDELNRDMLGRRLARRGYTVASAADGPRALALIEAQRFDVILLDIMMPGVSGLEVLQRLRQRYSMADLPVIMATAKDQSRDIVDALKLGANDYVTKPLDFPVVLARLETQVSLKRAKEEIQQLVEQLEVRNRFIRTTFGRYLSDEVVASLLDSPEGLRLGGERRKVTFLVSDLRGFMPLSERLAPEQVVAIANRYLETMVDVILPYQGTIQELMGDGLLVFFGAPIWREDDAQRAVACAVAMQLAMATVNEQNRREGLPEVEMGIGIHTGEVVVGNIGSYKRTKYGAVGNHVNLAFRIESYTIGGQILISEATRQEVGPVVRSAAPLYVEAKGVERPLTLYEVQAIGGAYNLALPGRKDLQQALVRLPQEIPLRYSVLAGKHASGLVFTGSIVKLSEKAAEIRSDHPVAPLSDLKMQLIERDDREIPGDLYGKVMGDSTECGTGFIVHFTSIPPQLVLFLQHLTGHISVDDTMPLS
jgi:adenylate cyclase